MNRHRLWLFETNDGYMACDYDISSYRAAVTKCQDEYGKTVVKSVLVKLPDPEYRALISVNSDGEAYSALIGVFMDAYTLRYGYA